MIKKKVKVYSTGQMEGNTKVDGRTENNMELEHTHLQVAKLNKVNGKMVKDYTGLQVIILKKNELIFSIDDFFYKTYLF